MIYILHDLKDPNYGKFGIFLIMGTAGFILSIPSTVGFSSVVQIEPEPLREPLHTSVGASLRPEGLWNWK